MSPAGYGECIARFLAECRQNGIGSEVRMAVRRSFLDTVGVALAGSLDQSAKIGRDVALTWAGPGVSTVLGSRVTLSPGGAALANGVAAHALDFDDVSMRTGAHSSGSLVPAALAAGELVDAPIADVFDAFAIGHEVIDRLGSIFSESSFRRGWHGTGILGPLGSSMTAAYLLRLDAAQCADALGIAAASAGAVYRNIGTMVKPFHAGRASMSGVLAAMLARQGFQAAADALEGPLGFAKAFAGRDRVDPLPALGRPFSIIDPGAGIKSYPVGSPLMGAIEGTLHLVRTHGIAAAEVRRIRIGVSDKTRMIARHDWPTTVYAARYSIPYCVAACIHKGRLGLDEFTPALLTDAAMSHLMGKASVQEDPEFFGREGWPPPTRIQIATEGGEYAAVWEKARGMRSGGYLSERELVEKYMDCAARVLGTDRAAESLDYFDVDKLDRPIRTLLRSLTVDNANISVRDESR